jgi:hypothetical protein
MRIILNESRSYLIDNSEYSDNSNSLEFSDNSNNSKYSENGATAII